MKNTQKICPYVMMLRMSILLNQIFFYIAQKYNRCMCQHENLHPQRRGNKRLNVESGDPFEANFKTSMLFTKSMKSLSIEDECR
jgi:hypothetical protein